jgi:20S proteasome subunit beta 4
MDSVFGICGKDWVIVATDTAVNRSIFTLKNDEDKIMDLNSNKVLAVSGEQTDRYQFTNLIQKNLQLEAFRTGVELSVDASAQYMRNELAQALRRGPYQVNSLIGGFEKSTGEAKLYWMDYLGTLQQVTKGAHGYAAYFVNSVLDNDFRHDMTLDQGIVAMKKCIVELRARFIIKQPSFVAKVVTKDGIHIVSLE